MATEKLLPMKDPDLRIEVSHVRLPSIKNENIRDPGMYNFKLFPGVLVSNNKQIQQ